MNEDNTIAKVAEVAPKTDFPEPERAKKPFPKELPPSSDSEMWDDADMQSVSKTDIEDRRIQLLQSMNGQHSNIKMAGRAFICYSCPFEHTLPINPNKFTLNHKGVIVPIDSSV